MKVMKQPIGRLVVSVMLCAIGSLITYPIAYHSGYKTGEIGAIERNCLSQSCGFFAALQSLRAGDVPRATRQMEKFCFDAAEIAYKDPLSPPYDEVAKALARDLLKYRAIYRTNSADWDTMERKLEAELPKVK